MLHKWFTLIYVKFSSLFLSRSGWELSLMLAYSWQTGRHWKKNTAFKSCVYIKLALKHGWRMKKDFPKQKPLFQFDHTFLLKVRRRGRTIRSILSLQIRSLCLSVPIKEFSSFFSVVEGGVQSYWCTWHLQIFYTGNVSTVINTETRLCPLLLWTRFSTGLCFCLVRNHNIILTQHWGLLLGDRRIDR